MTETVNIEVYCDIEEGEEVVFGVASEHRPDLPKPFNDALQEWVTETFGGKLDPGEGIERAGEIEYEPDGEIIEFRQIASVHPFGVGDRVRVDIPDETDSDHPRLHGEQGEVVAVIEDDASDMTGDERDNVIYRVDLDAGDEVDLRWRDLRPSEK